MPRRMLLLALACLLLAAGCAPESRSAWWGEGSPAPGEPASNQKLLFLVDSAGDATLRDAAERFAAKVTELSAGEVVVEVAPSVSPAADFAAGKAQLFYADSRKDNAFCDDFAALCAPMRYKSYELFTMGLNDGRLLEAVNDRLDEKQNALLLGAFYQGAGRLLGASAGGGLSAAAVGPDSASTALLEQYGMEVRAEQNPAARLALLQGGAVAAAEFSPAELDSLAPQVGAQSCLILPFSVSPLWLAVDRDAYRALSPKGQGAVTEALAYLFPLIDGHYLARDSRILQNMQEGGAHLASGANDLLAAARALDEEDEAGGFREKYLLGILSEIA